MSGLELWLAAALGVVIWTALVWRFVLHGGDLSRPLAEVNPLELVPARLCACGCGLPTSSPERAYRLGHDHRGPELVAQWHARADRLEAYARDCRSEGIVHGAEGAEDAEAAAREYRLAADELEHELERQAGAGDAA